MRLTIVGCSGSASGPHSPASSYLVQAPYAGRTFPLVLDLGPGAFGGLYRYLDPAEVDAIALSHLHPDHCLDLCALYVAGRCSPTAPWPRRPVYAPAGAAQRLARAYDVPGPDGEGEGGPGIAEWFDFPVWRPEQQIGPFTVRTARVAHPVEAYALAIEEVQGGGRMVYSGDTGPCPELVELARGADLLLTEAGFGDAPAPPPGVHLSGPQAAEIGQQAGVGEVVLTHIPPWLDPERVRTRARPDFDGPLSLARPGLTWNIGASVSGDK